jgi:hypothetical protein
MNAGKRPVRLSQMNHARAIWRTMHPESGELPGVFRLEFGEAAGPAAVSDGRALIAALTPAELADVLGAIPALSLTRDDDDLRALMRVTKLLRGEAP